MATVVSVVLRTLLTLVAAGLILSVVHGGRADVSVCVTDDSTDSSDAPVGLLPEAGAQVGSVPRYCTVHPDATLRVLNQLGALPSTLLLISGLFLLHRLLQGAARDGVCTASTAARLRLLDWWLLLGSLVVEITEANARAAVLADLAQAADFTAGTWLRLWSPPLPGRAHRPRAAHLRPDHPGRRGHARGP